MILNTQPIEKQDLREDGSLDVVDVWLTIQGEGPLNGAPAVFIRLAGCDLQCPLCDTDYTTGRTRREAAWLARQAAQMLPGGLVVLTGGEPLRQRLGPLVRLLLAAGHRVQIETNGTLYEDLPIDVIIVISPKSPSIHHALAAKATAFKYVLGAGQAEEDGLPSVALGGMRPARPPAGWLAQNPYMLFIQPLDEADEVNNKAHVEEAVASCLAHGYRLCLQVHKLVGLK